MFGPDGVEKQVDGKGKPPFLAPFLKDRLVVYLGSFQGFDIFQQVFGNEPFRLSHPAIQVDGTRYRFEEIAEYFQREPAAAPFLVFFPHFQDQRLYAHPFCNDSQVFVAEEMVDDFLDFPDFLITYEFQRPCLHFFP